MAVSLTVGGGGALVCVVRLTHSLTLASHNSGAKSHVVYQYYLRRGRLAHHQSGALRQTIIIYEAIILERSKRIMSLLMSYPDGFYRCGTLRSVWHGMALGRSPKNVFADVVSDRMVTT
jgi:hypothetical protein